MCFRGMRKDLSSPVPAEKLSVAAPVTQHRGYSDRDRQIPGFRPARLAGMGPLQVQ